MTTSVPPNGPQSNATSLSSAPVSPAQELCSPNSSPTSSPPAATGLAARQLVPHELDAVFLPAHTPTSKHPSSAAVIPNTTTTIWMTWHRPVRLRAITRNLIPRKLLLVSRLRRSSRRSRLRILLRALLLMTPRARRNLCLSKAFAKGFLLCWWWLPSFMFFSFPFFAFTYPFPFLHLRFSERPPSLKDTYRTFCYNTSILLFLLCLYYDILGGIVWISGGFAFLIGVGFWFYMDGHVVYTQYQEIKQLTIRPYAFWVVILYSSTIRRGLTLFAFFS